MKLLNPISNLQIKRCFVVGNICARRTHKGHMKAVESAEHYKHRVAEVKKKVFKMAETEIDKIIGGEWKKRLDAYNDYSWSLAEMTPKELGVWNRAGELPVRWTNRSLEETAKKLRRALGRKHGFKHAHIRAAHAIPGIIRTAIPLVQEDDYLLPIVFKGNTGTRGRHRLKFQTVGDVDDGCMRAIALAVTGTTKLRVYFGVPMK